MKSPNSSTEKMDSPATSAKSSTNPSVNQEIAAQKHGEEKKENYEVSAAQAKKRLADIRTWYEKQRQTTEAKDTNYNKIDHTKYDVEDIIWMFQKIDKKGFGYEQFLKHKSIICHFQGVKRDSQEDTDCTHEFPDLTFTEETAVKILHQAVLEAEFTLEEAEDAEDGEEISSKQCGSTLTTSLIFSEDGKRKVAVANVGDSRTYVVRKIANEYELIPLTRDHDIKNEEEIASLSKFKNYEIKNGYLWNKSAPQAKGLNMTKSIGDTLLFKDLPNSHNSDITLHELNDNDQFLLQFCDGVIEKGILNEGRIEVIINHYAQDGKIDKIPEAIIMAAFNNRKGSEDNISVLFSEIKQIDKPLLTAIFDGHGGSQVAEFLAENFGEIVEKLAQRFYSKPKPSPAPSQSKELEPSTHESEITYL